MTARRVHRFRCLADPAGFAGAWARVAALLLLLAIPAAAQQGSGVPEPVLNRASASYTSTVGNEHVATDSVYVYISRGSATGGLVLEPPGAITLSPGARHGFAHVLRNEYLADDIVRLSLGGPDGWPAAVHADVDGDGLLGPRDTLITTDLRVAAGAQVPVLLVVTVPAAAPNGTSQLTLTATSVTRANVAASVADAVTVSRPVTRLAFSKAVSRAAANVGDTLTYTITALNTSAVSVDGAVLSDTLPAGLRLVPGTITRDGQPLTDATDADGADGTAGLVVVRLGSVAAGERTAVAFRVVVESTPAAQVTNVAVVTVGGESATSPPASTTLAAPEVRVGKVVVGDSVVAPGALLTWRIWYQNRSPLATATGATLVDTLPAGVTLVSAPGATASGAVLTWALAPVAPGDSISIFVTARVADDVAGDVIANTVHFAAVNAAAVRASARHRIRRVSAELSIHKGSEALEVAVGEHVAYTLTVRNAGVRPLSGLVVRDQLPRELRLVAGSVVGADSSRMDGTDLVFVINGPLQPAAQHVIRYTTTVGTRPRAGTIVNRATVSAEGRTVLAGDTAKAVTRVREGTPVESRTIIGKVWIDRDGDGRQGVDESGVPRVPVWGVNGEVVITDASGRFSFRDARPGTHAVRVELGAAAAAGYALAAGQDPIVMVRADGWTTPQVNFRLVPRAPAAAPSPPGAAVSASIVDTSSGVVSVDTLRVAALRTREERAAEERRAFVAGPAVTIFAPFDGHVGDASRIFVGVKGEPGRQVALYVGDSLVREAATRPDGVHDFLGVDLAPGAQRIRVKMQNSWGQVRWDSITVHRSHRPAAFEVPPGAVTLRSDETAPLRVRVLDRWGVPVGAKQPVTVAAVGAVVEGIDVDTYSVGEQRHTEAGGWLVLRLRGGARPGPGSLVIRGQDSEAVTVPVRVLPFVGRLMVTGAGEIGVGSTTGSFGAVTARGALDAETSIIVSFDSRRNSAEGGLFGRAYDPLAEARYPTLGDASEQRVAAPSENALALRVERGFDWFEAGDVETSGFSRQNGLFSYRRAVNGAQGQLTADNVTWRGFASLTRQQLERVQVRADGTSGPYVIGSGVRPGSERIVIEVRAADNAARVVSQQTLTRYTDYEFDAASGAILLRRPVGSTDAWGNPVFVVADVERPGVGTPRLIGGVRAESDLARIPSLEWRSSTAGVDSFVVGSTFVLDETAAAGLAGPMPMPGAGVRARKIVGMDARIRRGRFAIDGELLHGITTDSTDVASRFGLTWGDTAAVQMRATWMRVGEDFAGAIDSRLRAGTNEIGVAASARIGREGRAELRHDRQEFAQHGVVRQTTAVRATESLLGRTLMQELSLQQDESRGLVTDAGTAGPARRSSSLIGRFTLEATDRAEVWLEGVRRLGSATEGGLPDRIGTGMTYRLLENARLEASHLAVTGADGQSYTVTSTRLRADALLGAQAWGGIDRSVTGHASHAAVLGIDRRFRLTRGWSLQSSFERRFGLEKAPLADPVRALPFAQPEPDRWAAATTLAYAAGPDGARLNVKGEVAGGEAREGYRLDLAGEVPLGADGAVLTRHNWSTSTRHAFGAPGALPATGTLLDQRSLVGFAFRPTRSETLNMIAKVEWHRARNPLDVGAFADSSDRRRFIGATDAIWSPRSDVELAARYALRYNGWSRSPGAPGGTPVAHYVGMHVERRVASRATGSRLGVRLDGRYLYEQSSGVHRWSSAPSALVRLTDQLQLEAGYRLGELRDADFGGSGGAFASLGLRFTEDAMRSAASFWRDRL